MCTVYPKVGWIGDLITFQKLNEMNSTDDSTSTSQTSAIINRGESITEYETQNNGNGEAKRPFTVQEFTDLVSG